MRCAGRPTATPSAACCERRYRNGREWFVVDDGGGDPDRQATLLVRELDADNVYDGFWTDESDIVARIDDYVSETYLDAVPEERAD